MIKVLRKQTITANFLLGFLSIISQIIIMRKTYGTFYGNELTTGMILGGWMIWSGIGSIVLGRFADKIKNIPEILSLSLISIPILLFIYIFAIQSIKQFLKIPAPEIVSPHIIFLIITFLLSPICILTGFSFTLCSKLTNLDSKISIGQVYMYEALGAAFGGLLYSWVFIDFFSAYQTSLILGVLTSLFFLVTTINIKKVKYLTFTLLVIFIILLFVPQNRLDKIAFDLKWKGYNPIHSVSSRFSDLVLTENRGEYTFFSNSSPLFSYPDKRHTENITHLGLVQIKNPKNILIIGGAAYGPITEILKHNINHIDYVQIDPEITKIEKKFIKKTSEILNSKFLSIHNTDGRYFIDNIKNNKKYDLIILNLPDPGSASINRFYTFNFFKKAKNVLTSNGVILFSAGVPSNYITKLNATFLATLLNSAKKVFDEVKIIPLDEYYFIASNNSTYLTNNPKTIIKRLDERNIKTKFLRNYYADFEISKERLKFVNEKILEPLKQNKQLVNYDKTPIAYFYNTVLWSTHFGGRFSKLMLQLKNISFFKLTLFIVLTITIVTNIFKIRYKTDRFKLVTLSGIFATGFLSMTMEIFLLVSFEIICGQLFYRLGLIITAFMIGLFFGVHIISSNTLKKINNMQKNLFLILITLFGLYNISLIFLTDILIETSINHLIVTVLFILFTFTGALICGMIFQVGVNRYIDIDTDTGLRSGIINGIDHLGGAFGGLLTSLIIIPLYGLSCALILGVVLLIPTLALTFHE